MPHRWAESAPNSHTAQGPFPLPLWQLSESPRTIPLVLRPQLTTVPVPNTREAKYVIETFPLPAAEKYVLPHFRSVCARLIFDAPIRLRGLTAIFVLGTRPVVLCNTDEKQEVQMLAMLSAVTCRQCGSTCL